MLWDNHTSPIGINSTPIWAYTNITIHRIDTPQYVEEVHSDMLPHQVLHWAPSRSHLQRLTSISGRVAPNYSAYAKKQHIDVIGLQVGYAGLESREIGTYHPVPVHWGVKRWREASGWHDLESFSAFEDLKGISLDRTFAIDGPGGEVINQVAVSYGNERIRFSTN
jgi:hypothetical protein